MRVRRRGSPSTAQQAPTVPVLRTGGCLPAPHDDACRLGTPVDNTLPECQFCRADVAPGYIRGCSADRRPGVAEASIPMPGVLDLRDRRRTGLDRQRVTRVLRKSGVPLRPRGAGRRRALRRAGDPPDLPRLMRNLYEDAKLNSSQVSAILGMPERTVRERLRRYGITTRTRGRCNREDRKTVPAEVLQALYSRARHDRRRGRPAARDIRQHRAARRPRPRHSGPVGRGGPAVRPRRDRAGRRPLRRSCGSPRS